MLYILGGACGYPASRVRITLSVPNGCNFTTNFGSILKIFSMMSQYFLMNFSLSALSARIYPIVDFEVVGTLIYNGLSGFALKRL